MRNEQRVENTPTGLINKQEDHAISYKLLAVRYKHESLEKQAVIHMSCDMGEKGIFRRTSFMAPVKPSHPAC